MQENGDAIEISGDDVFKNSDGKLTTMYHYKQEMENKNHKNEPNTTESKIAEELNA